MFQEKCNSLSTTHQHTVVTDSGAASHALKPLPLLWRNAMLLVPTATRFVSQRVGIRTVSLDTSRTSYSFFPPRVSRSISSSTAARSMSSDDAYGSFLEQANQDTGASNISTTSKNTTTKAVDTDVPVRLQKVEQYYTSEADEPFEPVSLKWGRNNMPSESQFYKSPLLSNMFRILTRRAHRGVRRADRS